MTLLIYLVLFLAVLYLRRRHLIGAHMKSQMMDGAEYFHHISYDGKKRTAATVYIGLPLAFSQHVVIRRERWYHRFLKSVNLAQDAETGDNTLDRDLFFISDTPAHLDDMIRSEKFRAAINTLFNGLRVHSLHAMGTRLWVRCEKAKTADCTTARDRQHLAALSDIANEMDAAARQSIQSESFFSRARLAIGAMVAHAGLICLGTLGFLPLWMESYQITNPMSFTAFSVTLAAFFAVGWFWILAIVFGGSSWFPLVIVDFILMGLIGIILSTGLLARQANIVFDTRPPELHHQALQFKACTLTCSRSAGKRRRSTTHELSGSDCSAAQRPATLAYYKTRDNKCNSSASFNYQMYLKPWHTSQGMSFSYSVDAPAYDAAQIGDIYTVPAHPGLFGHEWVDTNEIQAMKK
jgi:hypothetical protein